MVLNRLFRRVVRAQTYLQIKAARRRARAQFSRFRPPYRLNVGCGEVRFDGWINVDLNDRPGIVDVVCDVTQPIPLPDGQCELIYNEHLLEHLTIDQGVHFLSECHRLLSPDGVLRIAMPSLEYILSKYASEDWRDQDWLTWPAYRFIQTRAEMVNIALRWWGHQWVYDREELHRRLREAGFSEIVNVDRNESTHPELRQRETRPDSRLICEARKSR